MKRKPVEDKLARSHTRLDIDWNHGRRLASKVQLTIAAVEDASFVAPDLTWTNMRVPERVMFSVSV